MKSEEAIRNAAFAARQWLRQAHYAAGGKGFAHSCWLFTPRWWRWHKPYPETSGYLIENFINNDSAEDDNIAKHTSDWLCDIQHPDGYFFLAPRESIPVSSIRRKYFSDCIMLPTIMKMNVTS